MNQKTSFARTISDMPSTHPVSLGLLGPAIFKEIGLEQQDSQSTSSKGAKIDQDGKSITVFDRQSKSENL